MNCWSRFSCFDSLIETGCDLIAEGRLSDIIRRIHVFGLSLVRLDIRQEASRHTDAMNAVTQFSVLEVIRNGQKKANRAFLIRELSERRPLFHIACRLTQRFKMYLIHLERLQSPSGSLGAYVISMATHPSDVLVVQLFQRAFGVKVPLRVVPLLETLDDSENAADSVSTLLQLSPYRGVTGVGNHAWVF